MLNKANIYERFASCYSAVRSAQLAKICGVSHSTANRWKSEINPIPLKYLKRSIDKHGVSWDWLMEGKEPQFRLDHKSKRNRPLNPRMINKRFLSLFPGMSQADIAKEVGVKQSSVNRWFLNLAQVSRDNIKYAVDAKGVTWEWILEGRK